MTPLRRLLPNAIAAISLFLCLAIAALWLRGISTNDEAYLNLAGHRLIAGSFPHHAHFIVYRNPIHPRWMLQILPGIKHVPPDPIFWQPRFTSDPQKYELSIPWWLPQIFLLAISSWTIASAIRRHRRRLHGVCPHCGYDLRATPDRCPECGTTILPK